MSLKIITVVGARPQFVKAAAVSRAIANLNRGRAAPLIDEKIVHTGQHYDANMSDVFFAKLGIPTPAYSLGVGSGLQGGQTGRMLAELETVMLTEKPDVALLYGDTNSTLAGAMAAVKLHIPIAHVEAGLRSFNRRMPEEINRVMTDHVSAWLFCPTETAVANLAREGIHQGVYNFGDVMFDGMLHCKQQLDEKVLRDHGLQRKQYVLATAHRAENTDNPARLHELAATLAAVASKCGTLILPLHPRTRQAFSAHAILLGPKVRVVDPLPYLELVALLEGAAAVLTDSGGVQKEAFFLSVPCLTMRDETEWVETVNADANRLVGCNPMLASDAYDALIHGVWKPAFSDRPYGEGSAAEQILTTLRATLGSVVR